MNTCHSNDFLIKIVILLLYFYNIFLVCDAHIKIRSLVLPHLSNQYSSIITYI